MIGPDMSEDIQIKESHAPPLEVTEQCTVATATPIVLRAVMEETGPEKFPDLMTEAELIEYLRIPEISSSGDHHNVIENLKRMHKLPSVHMCNKCLYPLEAVKDWLRERTINHG